MDKMNSRQKTMLGTAAAAFGLGFVAYKLRQSGQEDLNGRVVVITGGSRGLGFALAEEFAREGCRVVICARDTEELKRAQVDLINNGAEVLAMQCDVSDRKQVQRLVDETTKTYGRIDILVNNAGIIQVGPAEMMTVDDFEEAMGVMYWGMLYPIWAVLPQMRQRQAGHIVNITSVGGKVSVPHLLPYVTAKYAAAGLSEGLQAELSGDGIQVTTIIPGLMRTGSHLNAKFKGDQPAEYTWFSLGASLPVISMDAHRAARQIVEATRRGDAERILSIPAQMLARFHGVFPGLSAGILSLVNRYILPDADTAVTETKRGMEIERQLSPPHNRLLKVLTTLGSRAAERLHQFPGPSLDGDERRNEHKHHNEQTGHTLNQTDSYKY